MGVMWYGAGVAPAVWSWRRWGVLAVRVRSRAHRRRDEPANGFPNGRFVFTALLVALAVGGCSDRSSGPKATPTSTTAPSATSSTFLSADKAAVFDSYVRCWRAYIDFGTEQTRSFTRADFDARVGNCLTGDEYKKLLHSFSNYRPQGVFFRGPAVEHDPEPEVELNGSSATVRDCMLDQGEVFDADDGRVLDPASGARTLNVVTLSQVDGSWKIAGTQDGGPCTA